MQHNRSRDTQNSHIDLSSKSFIHRLSWCEHQEKNQIIENSQNQLPKSDYCGGVWIGYYGKAKYRNPVVSLPPILRTNSKTNLTKYDDSNQFSNVTQKIKTASFR